ncbi:MAG: glycosyltransferase [Syntrophothermus sp.]
MNITYNEILYTLFWITGINLILILYIYYVKLRSENIQKSRRDMRTVVVNETSRSLFLKKIHNKRIFMEQIIRLRQSIDPGEEAESRMDDFLKKNNLERKFRMRLKSRFKFRRMEAAVLLGYMGGKETKQALTDALACEKEWTVRLYIVNSLSDLKAKEALPVITETLVGAPEWYTKRVYSLIEDFGIIFYEYIPYIINRPEREIQKLIISFASYYPARDLKEYLLQKAGSEDSEIVHSAVEAIAMQYSSELENDKYLWHKDIFVRQTAVRYLAGLFSADVVKKLILCCREKELEALAVASLTNIVLNEPKFLSLIVEQFYKSTNERTRESLAKVLSNRIDYFLYKIQTSESDQVKMLIRVIIRTGILNGIISFLNKNRIPDIDDEILPVLKDEMKFSKKVEIEVRSYLNETLLHKIDHLRFEEKPERKSAVIEKEKIVFLYVFLLLVLLPAPLIYTLKHFSMLSVLPLSEQLKLFIVDFNYYIVIYSFAISAIILALLFLSIIESGKQERLWSIKTISFLFKKNILPGVSIIAPAYNEEANIIESVNSLLNLRYPDYELIVVNDGSKDKTLEKLIRYFDLSRTGFSSSEKITTKPVRGIYLNKQIPRLLVIDKVNGGKADALNVGINYAGKEYVSAIDADSLLESDSLIRIASTVLNSEEESVAMGGNVFPVNGCTVHKGVLEKIALSTNRLAQIQTIEYLRAFMAGRLGWAKINCLLIISGAFGLFKKQRVLEIGGYLAESGELKKSTVGEDMELVVRLSVHMRLKKLKHRIQYAYNANCWTEVPEKMKIIYRQRDRWHRGLLEILSFHRKVIFNPRYGSMGMISMPYFFIFEMLGPMFEFQGYLLILLAFLFGLLNIEIALLLFIATIALGILISLISLLIAERNENLFSFREITVMVLLAITENFGYRQLMSCWRVLGYINSLRKSRGWGKMERKGFKK